MSLAGIPLPVIKCLLPEYEDKHVWSFVLQYLRSSGFQHTASAFCLELKGCRGVSEELLAVPEVWLLDQLLCYSFLSLCGRCS
jgi:hypothetical protein